MNDDLLVALKELLIHSIKNKMLPKIKGNEVDLELPSPPELTKYKAPSDDTFRVLHPIEREQFTNEAIMYLNSIAKTIALTRQAQEQLLDCLLDQENDSKITPSKIKWALLSMAPKNVTPLEYAFLDFVLTPNLDPTQ